MQLLPLTLLAAACQSLSGLSACARTPEPPVAAPASAVANPPESPAIPAPTASGARTDAAATASPTMIVHKSESCGCCGQWVEHMQRAGFTVEVRSTDNVHPVKLRVGVPVGKGSCHTAEIGGYFLEGHVPAADVKRLLAEKPDAKGLAVPGMLAGSPGMEMPDGRVQPYDVELVANDGSTTTFSHYGN